MKRRQLMKAATGIGAAAVVGGYGLWSAPEGARATAGGGISDPSPVTTDDGEIQAVTVQTTGRLNWNGFDKAATDGRIIVQVDLRRNGSSLIGGFQTIHDTGQFGLGTDWGGSGEDIGLSGDHEDGQAGYIASDADWAICQAPDYDGGNIPNNPLGVSEFTADADGSSQDTRVVLKSIYLLYNNGTELTGGSDYPPRPTAESDFVVTVNNEEASTSFGDEDGDGDTDDSADVVP